MDDCFVNLVENRAGCARRIFLKKKGQFRLCYDNLALLNQRLWLDESGTRYRHKSSHVSCFNRGLCTKNTYEHHHHSVCHTTLFPSRAWTDGKTNDIINCLYIYFESWSSRFWKGPLHFWLMLVLFGQSQCTVTMSTGQSEQTVLVGRRGFVEKDPFERR